MVATNINLIISTTISNYPVQIDRQKVRQLLEYLIPIHIDNQLT